LKEGDDLEEEQEERKAVTRPLVDSIQFKKELRGCVGSSKIDPLEAKSIWKA